MSRIAIYARKSVFREDSISIESQIEMCEYEARGEHYTIYQDNGFSGKNTARPDFQRMISDIESNKISKVIVYKLDRISRSILDFAKMMDLFKKHNVDFISATEHFDTSSPMGRAMLNICIVFAQLERETIQQRVIDAYASRSKKGFYMGGRIPYGYKKIPTVIDGVKTSMLEINADEAQELQLIFSVYSKPAATLGDVLRELSMKGKSINLRGSRWSTARLSEIMRNPIYVRADSGVYKFFKSNKTNIINPPEHFDGVHGCYLFKGENKNRKTWDLSGHNLVVAPHEGFIESSVWLTCRNKLLSNHQIKITKPKNSFLSGKVKCANCGYAMVIRKAKTKSGRYFVCTGRSEMHCCNKKLPTIYATEFEDLIVNKIKEKIDSLTIAPTQENDSSVNLKITTLENNIELIDKKIESLIGSIVGAEKVSMEYINKTIKRLDEEKRTYIEELENIKMAKETNMDTKELSDVMQKWDELNFEDKVGVVNLLVNRILVSSEKIEIEWLV